MDSHELKPQLRAQLFDALLQQHHNQGDWDKVFQLLNQGQQAARSAQLQEVAEKLEEGQGIVLQGLRDSGRFLDWELTILEVGLATGSIAESYRRLRDHYILQQRFASEIKRQCQWPIAMVALLLAGMYAWLVMSESMSWQVGAAVCIAAIALTILLVAAVANTVEKTLAGAAAPATSRRLGAVPLLGRVIRAGQLHHFFSNLAQSVAANLSLSQALKIAAGKTPDQQYHREFMGVYEAVQRGGRLSTALAQSGLLEGVAMTPMRSAKAGADEAMAHITESVYTDYVQRMFLLARSFPQLVFVMLLLIAFSQLLAL